MKIFLALLLTFFLPIMAHATPVTPQQGQQYYQNCVKKQDPNLLPQTQDVFCQCTAKYMMQNLTWEDVQMVAASDRPAINKMMIGVYAPCLQFPIRDKYGNECLKQGGSAQVCSCLGNNIGKFTSTEAQRLLGGVLAQHPNAFEPIAAIRQSPEFEAKEKEIATQCANGTLR